MTHVCVCVYVCVCVISNQSSCKKPTGTKNIEGGGGSGGRMGTLRNLMGGELESKHGGAWGVNTLLLKSR